MRILRGLSSRVLTCGCLTGLYETYDSEIVNVLDAHAPSCTDPAHQPGATMARTAAELVGTAAAVDRPRRRPDPD